MLGTVCGACRCERRAQGAAGVGVQGELARLARLPARGGLAAPGEGRVGATVGVVLGAVSRCRVVDRGVGAEHGWLAVLDVRISTV